LQDMQTLSENTSISKLRNNSRNNIIKKVIEPNQIIDEQPSEKANNNEQ